MNNLARDKRDQLITKLVAEGWCPQPNGTYARNVANRKYRVRLQEIAVRVEAQGLERNKLTGALPWLRMSSCYYTQIVDCQDGRLLIGSVFIGRKVAACEGGARLQTA